LGQKESEMELFLSVADASRILGVTPQTVRLMVRRGRLGVAAKTVGGIQLFRADQVERLAAARRERAGRTGTSVGAMATEPEHPHGGHP
jgi:excisionase family DNA binding protein